jgi:hypothetical protein
MGSGMNAITHRWLAEPKIGKSRPGTVGESAGMAGEAGHAGKKGKK